MKKTEKKDFLVYYNGKGYYGIKNFDCIFFTFYTTECKKGTFYSNLPISSRSYRIDKPTKAKVEISYKGSWTIFDIYDDYGDLSTFEIDNSLWSEIAIAKQKAFDYGLINSI